MLKSFLLVTVLLMVSCTSSSSSSADGSALKTRPKYKINVKYEDSPLKPAGEWLGGTENNPKYYTAGGEEILTPVFGVDVVPVTKRSVAPNGKVVYPHFGFEVIGDLRTEHFLALVNKAKNIKFDRSSYRPPVIIADSNFLDKGAKVKHPSGKIFAEYEFKALNWYRK